MIDSMDRHQVKRKHRRIKIKITDMSKINDTTCAIHNISREGMLVTAELKTPPFRVTIELRIRNRWVILKGNVMWCSNGRNSLTKKMGIFIIEAPAEFHDFIDNLYLEADEQTH